MPFRGLDRRAFYRSPTHDEALARLHYLADQHRRLGLLLGASGSGKTFLLEMFAQELRGHGGIALKLDLLGVGPAEFPGLLAFGLGLNPDARETAPRVWQMIAQRLQEHRYQRQTTAILLDDADEGHPETLDHVLRLSQMIAASDSQVTIVLAALPRRVRHLGTRLLSLAELRVELQPWEAADTAEFIREALRMAGRTAPAFSDAALAHLHSLSQGVPRRVSHLADLSLVAAAGQGLTAVDVETLDHVCQELGIHEAYAA